MPPCIIRSSSSCRIEQYGRAQIGCHWLITSMSIKRLILTATLRYCVVNNVPCSMVCCCQYHHTLSTVRVSKVPCKLRYVCAHHVVKETLL